MAALPLRWRNVSLVIPDGFEDETDYLFEDAATGDRLDVSLSTYLPEYESLDAFVSATAEKMGAPVGEEEEGEEASAAVDVATVRATALGMPAVRIDVSPKPGLAKPGASDEGDGEPQSFDTLFFVPLEDDEYLRIGHTAPLVPDGESEAEVEVEAEERRRAFVAAVEGGAGDAPDGFRPVPCFGTVVPVPDAMSTDAEYDFESDEEEPIEVSLRFFAPGDPWPGDAGTDEADEEWDPDEAGQELRRFTVGADGLHGLTVLTRFAEDDPEDSRLEQATDLILSDGTRVLLELRAPPNAEARLEPLAQSVVASIEEHSDG